MKREQSFFANGSLAIDYWTFMIRFGQSLRWIGFSAFTWLRENQTEDLGFDWFVELGGGVALMDGMVINVVEGLSIRDSVLAGNDVTGWTLGAALEF